jgi:hypothetical protein
MCPFRKIAARFAGFSTRLRHVLRNGAKQTQEAAHVNNIAALTAKRLKHTLAHSVSCENAAAPMWGAL